MARLPQPGADEGQWGEILNEYLRVSHAADGSLYANSISSSLLQTGSVTQSKLAAATAVAGQVLSSDGNGLVWVDVAEAADVPLASTTVRGIVRLSGDLTGDSLSPLIAAGKVTGGGGGAIATGTITDANIHSSANISKSKLAPLALTNGDIAVGAAIVQSKIQNLVSDLADKASVAHTHTVNDVANLQTELDSKAELQHQHGAGEVTSGTFALARLPTGTTASTVALGNHTHADYALLTHYHDGRYYTKPEVDAGLTAKLDASEKGVADGVATLGSDGKILTAQLPALAINDVFTVASQAAMLALTAQRGDVAVRTDSQKTFILAADSAATLGDWKEITTQNAVMSVAGKTGVVSLDKADVGLGNVDNTSDANKPVSNAMQTALNAKANTAHTHATSDVTTGTFDIARLPTGTSASTVALGNHTHSGYAATTHGHSAADVTAGTFDIARLPTGTSASTVALGNHTHAEYAPISHTHNDLYYTESEMDSALATKLNSNQKGVSNGVATLGSDGKIPTSQLPALAVKDVFTVASQVAMLALTAERGDMAIRTDIGRTFVLASDSPSTLGDWKEITAQDAVTSVAGKTGVVSLTKTDVGLANVDNTADLDKPVSTATQTALSAKAASVHTHAIADVTSLQTSLDGKASTTHAHAATDITSGTLAIARIPTGTTSTTVSLGNHSHAATSITSGTLAIARIPTGTTATTVSLGDHTHDTRYYQKTEVDTALAGKIGTAEKAAANGVATLGADSKLTASQLPALTKTSVGLANVDNTSDANKPISTATQTALNGKVASVNGLTGIWRGTQAAYDAIVSKDANTLYIVTG